MIMRTRRALLRAVRALLDDGTVPAGVDRPDIYFGVRSGEMLTTEGSDWLERYDALRAQARGA
jgi:hypothetical protein